jgi:hypothetical protein
MNAMKMSWANIQNNTKDQSRFAKVLGTMNGAKAVFSANEKSEPELFAAIQRRLLELNPTGDRLGNKVNARDNKGLPFAYDLEPADGGELFLSEPEFGEDEDGNVVEKDRAVRARGAVRFVKRPPVKVVD